MATYLNDVVMLYSDCRDRGQLSRFGRSDVVRRPVSSHPVAHQQPTYLVEDPCGNIEVSQPRQLLKAGHHLMRQHASGDVELQGGVLLW